MEINGEESEVMRMQRQPFAIQIIVGQKLRENVEYFKYLCSIITNDARWTREVNPVLPWQKQHSKGDFFQQIRFKSK